MIGLKFQQPNEATRDLTPRESVSNFVSVLITFEADGDIELGEYSWTILSSLSALGKVDFDLIEDEVNEVVAEIKTPEEGQVYCIMQKTGEWEDIFFNPYYVTIQIEVQPDWAK